MAIYANFSPIKGNVTTTNYKDWVALNFIQLGTQRSMSMRVGTVVDRMSSALQFSEVTLYKKSDPATVDLFSFFCSNEPLKQIEIHLCADSENSATPSPTVKYIFYNAAVTNHQHYATVEGVLTEELSLHYTKMEMTYLRRDAANKPLPPKRTGYDLEKASKL